VKRDQFSLAALTAQIQHLDKGIDNPGQIVFPNIIIQTFWQQHHLITRRTLDKIASF